MPKKIQYGGPTYRRRLGELARIYLNVRTCRLCGSPHADGYICPFCNGDDSIPQTMVVDEAYENTLG